MAPVIIDTEPAGRDGLCPVSGHQNSTMEPIDHWTWLLQESVTAVQLLSQTQHCHLVCGCDYTKKWSLWVLQQQYYLSMLITITFKPTIIWSQVHVSIDNNDIIKYNSLFWKISIMDTLSMQHGKRYCHGNNNSAIWCLNWINTWSGDREHSIL